MSGLAQPAAAAWRQYLCRVCGLVYDEAVGDADSGLAAGTRFEDIPDDWACPICGVGKADFELCLPAAAATPRAAAAPQAMGRSRREPGVVIVGAGRAGWQVAQALRERSATLPITLVSACRGDVYDKPKLSVAVARELDPATLVRETAASAAARLKVRLLTGTHAVAVDAPRHRLRTTRGTLPYRQLVLAQGAQPALPACLPAALVWRVNDLAAYQALRAALNGRPQRLVIVGAGLVGCELANDLALAGHAVTLLDQQARPLAAQLPAAASQRLLRAWQGLHISFLGGIQVQGVTRQADGAGLQVLLRDGPALQADHVIAATGLRAGARLAASAGLAYDGPAGGITADAATLRTSHADIHALGDCVAIEGQASRYIEPIARQAQAIAACIVAGPPAEATRATAPPVLRVKTSALPITVSGHVQPGEPWFIDGDDANGLRMHQRQRGGGVAATLWAQPPAAARRFATPGA